MYSYGPPHMAEQKQDDQLEHTHSSYVRIRDVALKTCQRRWTIRRSGERGSGISVLAARHDDDDDDCSSTRMDLVLNNPQRCLPAFARPCAGVQRRTPLIRSSRLLQQCPACMLRLTLIVIVTGDRWPYSCCFVGCASRTCSKLFAAFLCSCRQEII